jgi:glycosyltransferase involved in cell wall biosynthesis
VRKNPFAVIKAFHHAFPSDSPAILVIKVNNAKVHGEAQQAIIDLQTHCGADSRIWLITEDLSYEDVLSLYASCDVFASLHRSEGLGLGLMEAWHSASRSSQPDGRGI